MTPWSMRRPKLPKNRSTGPLFTWTGATGAVLSRSHCSLSLADCSPRAMFCRPQGLRFRFRISRPSLLVHDHGLCGVLSDSPRNLCDEVCGSQETLNQLKRQPRQFIERRSYADRSLNRIRPAEAYGSDHVGWMPETERHRRGLHVVFLRLPLAQNGGKEPSGQPFGP